MLISWRRNAFFYCKQKASLSRINITQSFYRIAIRTNKECCGKMAKKTWAVLNHCSSTLQDPKHGDCPIGLYSWYSYQRDVAKNTNEYKPIKTRYLQHLWNKLNLFLIDLGGTHFYMRVNRVKHKSLHYTIWNSISDWIKNSLV